MVVPKNGDYFDEDNFFKDKLFEVLDESSSLEIADIETDDLSDIFTAETTDGSVFEIECRKGALKNNMTKDLYITDNGHEKCIKRMSAFTVLYEATDSIVLGAGKYGVVKYRIRVMGGQRMGL